MSDSIFKDQTFVESLLAQSSYRDFLSLYIEKKRQLNSKYSFTVFSKKAGLQSRSFIRDVVAGDKDLGPKSYQQIVQAMQMPALIKRYFGHLAASECNLGPAVKLVKQLENLKTRILNSLQEVQVSGQAYKNPHIPRVFAALGELPAENFQEQLAERTALPKAVIQSTLEDMQKLELIQWNQDKSIYEVRRSNIVFEDERERQSHFQRHYLHALEQLAQTARNNYNRQDQLFLASQVLIKRDQFPEFKQKLTQLMCDYIEEIESDSGDQVVSVTLGMGL